MIKVIVFIAAIAVLCSTTVFAADHFGITVYPGAQSDAAAQAYCGPFAKESIRQTREMFKGTKDDGTFCYHTNDEFSKVVAFYQKHKGRRAPRQGERARLFEGHSFLQDRDAMRQPW